MGAVRDGLGMTRSQGRGHRRTRFLFLARWEKHRKLWGQSTDMMGLESIQLLCGEQSAGRSEGHFCSHPGNGISIEMIATEAVRKGKAMAQMTQYPRETCPKPKALTAFQFYIEGQGYPSTCSSLLA